MRGHASRQVIWAHLHIEGGSADKPTHIYLDADGELDFSFWVCFKAFCNTLCLLSPMIPISLYVTMDMVNIFLQKFIEFDANMYARALEAPATCVRKIHEELGQVEYIFSDKTGTLTCNEMVLKKVCIAHSNGR
jgi:P-type E1-E2 ATPase